MHPLENYRIIANSNFIYHVEDNLYIIRYSELTNNGGDFEITRERENNRLKIVGFDIWGKGFIAYETLTNYFLFEYNKLEKEARSKIDEIAIVNLDYDKQKLFIENIIAELRVLQNDISKFLVEEKYEVYKSILLDKVKAFSMLLNDLYLSGNSTATPKIQWLGKTNVLATLFYDLWQGQDKGKQPSTKQLLKAQKKDLEALLINNFLDEKGKPLTENTISDYLNSSKPLKRAKEGVRIELIY